VALGEHEPAAWVEARVGDATTAWRDGAGAPVRADGAEADVVEEGAGEDALGAWDISWIRSPGRDDAHGEVGTSVAAVSPEVDTAERRRFLVAMAGGAALDRQMGFLSLRAFRKSQFTPVPRTNNTILHLRANCLRTNATDVCGLDRAVGYESAAFLG
jgi:hypothetical protein